MQVVCEATQNLDVQVSCSKTTILYVSRFPLVVNRDPFSKNDNDTLISFYRKFSKFDFFYSFIRIKVGFRREKIILICLLQVKVSALQCLVKIMSLYYQYMEAYMGQVSSIVHNASHGYRFSSILIFQSTWGRVIIFKISFFQLEYF